VENRNGPRDRTIQWRQRY